MTVIIHIITPDYFWYLANGKCPGQLQLSWREVWSRVAGAEQTVRGGGSLMVQEPDADSPWMPRTTLPEDPVL